VAGSIHSLSNLVADFVVLLANHHAKREADENHPYGHQRFETAASLVLLGIVLSVPVVSVLFSFAKPPPVMLLLVASGAAMLSMVWFEGVKRVPGQRLRSGA